MRMGSHWGVVYGHGSQSGMFLFLSVSLFHIYSVGVLCEHGTFSLQPGKREFDLSRQMSLLKAATTTRIEEESSPTNVTAIRGETAMLVCNVVNVGDKSVSWLKHSLPIPQLLALNNLTNTLNPRYKAMVSGAWTEFVLVIKDVRPRDSGTYECQVSGPRHSSINRIISLTVIESMTEIVGGPDIYVDRLSTLQLTCRVTSGDNTPAFIIWQKEDKILKFDGGETSLVPYLVRDSEGRHLSSLQVDNIGLSDSGEFTCQPAVGPIAAVIVHVLNRDTEVQAVLGEGGDNSGPAVTLPSVTGAATTCHMSHLTCHCVTSLLATVTLLRIPTTTVWWP